MKSFYKAMYVKLHISNSKIQVVSTKYKFHIGNDAINIIQMEKAIAVQFVQKLLN